MRSIAIINQKGGCGKTTTAVNLSSCLAEAGKSVLLIDCDPQSHASIGLGIDTEELPCSAYELFMDEDLSVHGIARTVAENLDLVPASVILCAVEQQLAGQPDRENRLRRKLEPCEELYDYVLIDCPPNIGLLTFNALVACKESLIVMEPSYYSLHGATKVIQTIRLVREQLSMIKRTRLLLTLFDKRTKFAKEFFKDTKTRFGLGLHDTIIRRTTRFREASTLGVPINQYEKKCSGAEDYRSLAKEIIAEENSLNIDDFELIAQIKDELPATGMNECILSQPGPHIVGNAVLFSLDAPEAREVELVGSFTHWSREDAIPLEQNSDGLWLTQIELVPGRHLYKFIIDEQWCADPANTNRIYPEENCIIDVPMAKSDLPPQVQPQAKQEPDPEKQEKDQPVQDKAKNTSKKELEGEA